MDISWVNAIRNIVCVILKGSGFAKIKNHLLSMLMIAVIVNAAQYCITGKTAVV